MWRVRRAWAQFVGAFIAAGISGAGIAMCYSGIAEEVSSRPGSSVLMGAVVSIGIWWWAHLVRARLIETKDNMLFVLTPLTVRRYVVTNTLRIWPALIVIFVGFPLLGAYLLAEMVQAETTRDFSALAQVNFILTYFVMMLGPLSQSVPWKRIHLPWLFSVRYAGARFPKTTFLLMVVGLATNWATGGWVTETLRLGAEKILDLGDPGFMILAVLAPGSALFVQDLASPDAVFLYALVAAATLLIQVWPLSQVFSLSQRTWDHEELDFWIDRREEYLSSVDEWEAQEDAELEEWATGRASYESDTEGRVIPDTVAYDDAYAHEDQFACYMAAQDPRTATIAGRRVPLSKIQLGWLVYLLLLAAAWAITRGRSHYAEWFAVAALASAFGRNMFAGRRWVALTEVTMSLPLRMGRLVRMSEARYWMYNLSIDLFASGLFVLAFQQHISAVIALMVALQSMRYCSHLHHWLETIADTGKRWPDQAWNILAVLLWFTAFMVFVVGVAEPKDVAPALWWWTAGTGVFSVSIGIVLLVWLHRKTDSCVLYLRTSRTARANYEDE